MFGYSDQGYYNKYQLSTFNLQLSTKNGSEFSKKNRIFANQSETRIYNVHNTNISHFPVLPNSLYIDFYNVYFNNQNSWFLWQEWGVDISNYISCAIVFWMDNCRYLILRKNKNRNGWRKNGVTLYQKRDFWQKSKRRRLLEGNSRIQIFRLWTKDITLQLPYYLYHTAHNS